MRKNWEEFKQKYENEQFAREAFTTLCMELFEIHFQGKIIESVSQTASNFSKDKSKVIYLVKFFLEDLSSSRKGQIRKAFNDTLIAYEKNTNQIFSWTLCIPMVFNEDELIWFVNWKTKMLEQNQINIQLFDGEFIIEILKKYNLYEKWFENKKENFIELPTNFFELDNEKDITIENNSEINQIFDINSEDIEFWIEHNKLENENKIEEIDEDNIEHKKLEKIIFNEIIETKTLNETDKFDKDDKKIELNNNLLNIENEVIDSDIEIVNKNEILELELLDKDEKNDSDFIIENKNKEPEIINLPQHELENNSKQNREKNEITNYEKSENNETDSSKNQDFIDEGKIEFTAFKKLKQQYNKITERHSDFSETQKLEFYNIFKQNKINIDRFEFKGDELDNYTTADLVYKARHFKVNENYEKALFVYEKILERNDFKIEVVEEIVAGKEISEKMILYRNYITDGDYYYSKNDKINALLAYENAFKLDNSLKEIIKKYNFTYAEALVEQNIYGLALQKYDAALKAEPNNKEIQKRREFARLMFLGTKVFTKKPASFLNPIIAPYYFNKAKEYDNSNSHLNFKLNKIKKNITYSIAIIAAVFLGLFLIMQIPSVPENVIFKDSKKIITMYDFLMDKGDFYRQNFTEQKPHYYDSAMIAYKNAIRYKPEDSLAASYFAESRQKKSDYITKAQQLIKLDSASYFISMRKPSEGLRLFKYLLNANDKSTGKFGYVDENMNIIVPPIFDFNFKKMDDIGERFKDGKALVCLIIAPGDTAYFYIDKFCNRVKN